MTKKRKQKFLDAFPAARQIIVDETVTATVGLGQPVEVRTVSALVHLAILNSRRGKAVADILSRAKAMAATSIPTQAPRSEKLVGLPSGGVSYDDVCECG